MLKLSELKEGDLVMAEYDGNWKEGEITNIDRLDNKVEVTTVEDQAFWYDVKHLTPVLLDEAHMFKLGFQKEPNNDGSVRYVKGAFRVLIHHPDTFSNFEMWYREDRRHINQQMDVHDFQNHYLAMTKVHLTKGE